MIPSDDGSTQFQQMMLNYLGNRDYYTFEYNELNHLEEKIGLFLCGPPSEATGYEDKQKTQIKYLLDIILKESNLVSKWKDRVILSIIYNCVEPLPEEKEKRARLCRQQNKEYSPEYDLSPIPIFILRKCKRSNNPCRVFIDHTGRVYRSWKGYLTENKLPECNMVVPMNGQYLKGPNSKVLLERHPSPACNPSPKMHSANIVSAIGAGTIGGGLMMGAAASVAAACVPLMVIGTGLYCIGEIIHNQLEKGEFKEDLSSENCESHGDSLNILTADLRFTSADIAMLKLEQLATSIFNMTVNSGIVESDDSSQGFTYLGRLSEKPEFPQSDVIFVSSLINDAFEEVQVEETEILALQILENLGNGNMTIIKKIISAVGSIINTLLGDHQNDCIGELNDIFPHHVK